MENNLKFVIQKGKIEDINQILTIIEDARELFKTYNSPQWGNGYPNYDSFLNDINNDVLYVCTHEDKVIGTMSIIDYDPCYDYIDGKWLHEGKYVAIHRIAVKKEYRSLGVASFMMDYVKHNHQGSIRIDTHRLNIGMQKFLLKYGFTYCGIIYLNQPLDKERLAFEFII
jgi:ribosomal protein S18 acetylase RimI-like enzyme